LVADKAIFASCRDKVRTVALQLERLPQGPSGRPGAFQRIRENDVGIRCTVPMCDTAAARGANVDRFLGSTDL
jgi:hypothetical protein